MTENNVKSLRPNVNQEKLAEFIARRDQLLKEQPQLQTIQDKIDTALQSSGSVNNRLTTIQTLMLESFYEMRESLLDMQNSYNQLQDKSSCLKEMFLK